MKKWAIPAVVAAAIFAGAGPAAAAPSGPPQTADPAEFTLDNCGFPVTATLTGKFKNITTPAGSVISTSPGLKITLTANGKSLNYVITGTSRYTFFSNKVEVVSTGRNLLLLPSPDGLYLTTGNVNYALNLDNTELRRFSGPGTAVNVCPLLAP
jgi:hypothetical protein